MPRYRHLLIALLACTLGARVACADEEPEATPYRPSAANPAELSAPGWLEIEAGTARTKGGGPAWQNDTPWLLKLALSPDFGILLGGDAWVRQTDPSGASLSGRGDASLTFKHHWQADAASAFGLEWGVKFPTAANGIGSGKRDYGFNGIYSRDIGSYRIDANLGATRLGLEEAGRARWQEAWAVSVSHPLGDTWNITLEESGTYRRGNGSAAQWLSAVSYSVTPRLVLDAGISGAASATAPKGSLFMGVTYLAAQLW